MTKRMLSILFSAIAALSVASIAGASGSETSVCPAEFNKFIEHRIFFGRNFPDGQSISDEAWNTFLADEITPRFPAGLSVLDVQGQWKDASGVLVKDRTKLLLILASPGDGSLQLMNEVAEQFLKTYPQGSILRSYEEVCAAF